MIWYRNLNLWAVEEAGVEKEEDNYSWLLIKVMSKILNPPIL